MTRSIVFSGPSLTPQDRQAVDRIDFRPPASQGDILRAIQDRPQSIGLIDGYFGDRLAVHQKEILEAISSGVPVLGAASMGALRASELSPFGMIGIGKVFQDFVNGSLDSDAEVAIAHGPAQLGFAPTSVCLVDVRATLDSLRRQRRCDKQQIDEILEHAKSIHFLDRTWHLIARRAVAQLESAEKLESVLRSSHVHQKRLDAIKLVHVLTQGDLPDPLLSAPPPMTRAYIKIRDRSLSVY